MKRLLTFFILVSVLTSCKDDAHCHDHLVVENNSQVAFYVGHGWRYPDTLGFADLSPSPLENQFLFRVAPGERNETAIDHYRSCIEGLMNDVRVSPNGLMSIYLFREDSLQANPWENNPNLVLKRYDFTIEELDAINWTLIYP